MLQVPSETELFFRDSKDSDALLFCQIKDFLRSMPFDFIIVGSEDIGRKVLQILDRSNRDRGYHCLLSDTYLSLRLYHDAFWEIVSADSIDGFARPRRMSFPILTIENLPLKHLKWVNGTLFYVAPYGEIALHPSRYVQFEKLRLATESMEVSEVYPLLISRAIKAIFGVELRLLHMDDFRLASKRISEFRLMQ